MNYQEQELQQLQEALYTTLAEVDRICRKHGIRYFVTGGTAVGAYFWQKILPWDDDVDVGMMRPDYERFAEVAAKELGDRFFLQTPDTEPHTPFFFMKVRMNGSRFSESTFRHIKMHQGIFVDIFPFDKIPRQRWLESLQYTLFQTLNGLFIATEIWQWKHCGKCDIPVPRKRGWLPCLMTRLLITVLPKCFIYNIMYRVQTMFNGLQLDEVKNIVTKSEHLPIEDIKAAQTVTLGPLQVKAPRDLLLYLNNHYGTVRKDIPDEMKVSHRPEELAFPE
ncbi:MAG: LicD family protein [Bacteroidaceae bacterium]|nr:LicD family protein [Bacteroidaceae bacterium]MBQ9293990.1 LicD family protein [Bacteroidaceae bacterium]